MLPSIAEQSGAGRDKGVGSQPGHPLAPLRFDANCGTEKLCQRQSTLNSTQVIAFPVPKGCSRRVFGARLRCVTVRIPRAETRLAAFCPVVDALVEQFCNGPRQGCRRENNIPPTV
jgi:hypothetical protein